MKDNKTVLMMSAIAVLFLACACFGYSAMANKARAVKAESELAGLKKVVDAGLTRKTQASAEKRRPASPSSYTVTGFANMQNPEPAVEAAEPNVNQDRGRVSMEKLKESDPERYAEMVERRNSFTKQMHDNSAKQVDFFKKLDTKSMTPEQLENHNKLLPLVAKNNQLLYELAQNPDAENLSDIRRELGDNSRQMRDLLATERSAALQQFAKQIGYRSDQTAQFEAYVKSVYDMTSGNPFQGMQGGGRGGANNRGQGQPNRQ
ncbi:MAG: hypothetical protein WC637_08865 [Victivallales bacterium]|jgi:hypothetical protein